MKGHRDDAYLSLWRVQPEPKTAARLAEARSSATYKASAARRQAHAKASAPAASRRSSGNAGACGARWRGCRSSASDAPRRAARRRRTLSLCRRVDAAHGGRHSCLLVREPSQRRARSRGGASAPARCRLRACATALRQALARSALAGARCRYSRSAQEMP